MLDSATIMRYIVLLILFFAGIAAVAQQIPEPTFDDVFFGLDLSAGKLVSLERQTATIRGKAKFGGYGGIKLASEFKPGKSPVRFKSGEQQFVVRSFAAAASSLDPNTLYVLRTLKKKGDKRELVMTESHGPLGLGGATSNLAEGVLPVTFEKFGEHSLKIVSEKPLPPGEYALSRHRAALARRAAPRLRPATWRLREIPRRVPVLEPTAPRFMGCLFGFVHLTPSPLVGPGGAHRANNRLPALVDMDVLHRHFLL